MTYKLRVPQDGKFQKQEFVITPNEGTIVPGETEDIQLVLCSTTVKEYEVFLTVDVEGVGEGLLSIPVVADCRAPEIELKADELQFGNCFIRYNYEHEMCLVNSSDQMCRFKIMEQDEQSKAVATFEVESYEGVIAANSELIIPVKMRCEKLGNITLPVYVTIAGVKKPVSVVFVFAQSYIVKEKGKKKKKKRRRVTHDPPSLVPQQNSPSCARSLPSPEGRSSLHSTSSSTGARSSALRTSRRRS